jgi:transcriptional regulator with XRE-family HTH domain
MQQSMDLKEIGNRVKALRASLNLRQNQFAQKLEVSQSFLSYIEKGQRKPSFEFLLSLLSNLKVNLHWFLTGQGEMFNRDDAEGTLAERLGQLFPGLHPDTEVVRLVESLEVPIMKNALMEKYLLYRKKYEDFIREYRLKKEKSKEADAR